jgi:hypothetical protein
MQKFMRIAVAAAVFLCVPAGVLLAQTTPNAGTGTPATPAPAAAPAATTPATTTTPTTTTTTTTEPAAETKKKKTTSKTTRQQEIDKSVESGTVPSRYRKQVPKEYQQYIPFAK